MTPNALELKIHAVGEVAVVSSLVIAEMFDKDHKHVLRDIRALEIGPGPIMVSSDRCA
jgi:phage regulator Rha-like protein